MTTNIDPAALAGLVTREVRTGERGGAATRLVVARRTYATEQADLWNALTDPERIPRWFLPVSGELKLGGSYQLEGNAAGAIEACVEPDSFSVTWVYGGDTSWLTVNLAAAGDGTELELVHEARVYPSFWKQYGPGATGLGWELAIVFLGRHLETGEAYGPADESEFSASDAGGIFLRAVAEGWATAAIADGDDADEATQAAENSIGFYTPAPEGDQAT